MLRLEYFFRDTQRVETLEKLIQAAMLDPTENVRKLAYHGIKIGSGGMIVRGYEANNKLFVVLKVMDLFPMRAYICDVPETYIKGHPVTVYEFSFSKN